MGSNPKKKTRLVIKMIIIFFIIACAGPFFIKDKNGRPFISFGKIKVSVLEKYSELPDKYAELKHFLKLDTVPEAESDDVTGNYNPYKEKEYTEMYKYKDEKGVLHFTDKKPLKGKYEVLYMPVSKEGTIGQTVDSLVDKVFKKKKNEKKTSLSSVPKKVEPEKQGGILVEAKKLVKTAVDQYKDAPNTLNDAKELKKQVEGVYQEREKVMEDK